MSVVVHTNINAGDEETPLLISVHTADPAAAATLSQRRSRIDHRTTAITMASMLLWRASGLFGATAIALGAFGNHGLKSRTNDPQRLASWATAANYQLIHAVAMLAARGQPVASAFFAAGITIFSGTIYAMVWDPARFQWLGNMRPVGGICLMLGWLTMTFFGGRAQL